MTQNRNKLIQLFIGNLCNTIVHKILENAIDDEDIAKKYDKELTISFAIALRYREKINPQNAPLPEKDQEVVKEKIIRRVKAELMIRQVNGYKNIAMESVEKVVEEYLKEMMII